MTMINDLEIIARELVSSATDEYPCEGATPEELASLEDYAGCPLPESYHAFMLSFGHCAGPLFVGSDYAIDGAFRARFREEAIQLLARTKSNHILKNTDFVFLFHQGYQFFYFDCAEGPNPRVFRFHHREEMPVRQAESFTKFILGCI